MNFQKETAEKTTKKLFLSGILIFYLKYYFLSKNRWNNLNFFLLPSILKLFINIQNLGSLYIKNSFCSFLKSRNSHEPRVFAARLGKRGTRNKKKNKPETVKFHLRQISKVKVTLTAVAVDWLRAKN